MEELSVMQLQKKMESGEMTAVSILEGYLERIEKIDKGGPGVNAVLELNPDAHAIAETLDRERQAGKIRSPLHGIPVLLKDNIDTHDRMQTTSGSLALEGSIAGKDAFLVRRLRLAGALILGKANLSEWANFRGHPSTSGWSSRGGLTRNPYALDRSACGSSSGSAAAVAANLCSLAIGTETDGSIICPSQTNGIVGLKPTLGLVSRSGIIPVAHSQDTAGPMARTVAEAALLLGGMTGQDPRDPATHASAGNSHRDYRRFLKPDGLKGARIGVSRKMAGTNAPVLKIYKACLDVLKRLGALLVDPADLPNFDKFGKTEMEVLHYEFKADLEAYLAGCAPDLPVHSMKELAKFNQEHRARVMPYFGQEHVTAALKKGPLTSKTYLRALEKNHRLTQKEGIDALMSEHNLDAVVVPSGGPAWMIDLVNGDAINWDMESTSPAAVAGYPHITVPAGYIFGLPVGLSFFAGAWQEGKLLKYAYAFEQATHFRRPPAFAVSADLDLKD
jgi:amidase